MNITAALAWWDEEPAELADCIRGIANIADRVVALDGAYRRYPGATITSPPEQAKVIEETAAEVGLECLILEPDRLWAGQLEKRTYLVNAAAVNADWIVVVDADHIIHANRAAARAEIERLPTSIKVISAPYYVPMNHDRPIEQSIATDWHRRGTEKADPHRLLFRALPGLRYEYKHWWLSGMDGAKRVWVLHTDTSGEGLPAITLTSHYEVEHRCLFRDERRVLAGRAFCNDRYMVVDKTGQEDDVPGLPPPTFDFDTIPF